MSNVRVVGDLSFDTSKVLGQGSFGAVYSGFHRNEDKPVAVKRVLIQSNNRSTKLLKREVELMQQASNHLNILRYICTETDVDFM